MKIRRYLLTIIILIFVLLVCSCKTRTENSESIRPILDKEKYKEFEVSVVGTDFIVCKNLIIKNTLTYSTEKLAGKEIFDKNRELIEKALFSDSISIIKKFFLFDSHEIIFRNHLDFGLHLKMRVIVIIENLVKVLKELKIKNLDKDKLINAPLVLNF